MKLAQKARKVGKWFNRAHNWLKRTLGLDPVMPLDALPDLPLLTIFDHLPIEDLLDYRRVSQRWKALAETACRTRRSLVLLIGDGIDAQNEVLDEETIYTTLYCDFLSAEWVNFLLENLPNISILGLTMTCTTQTQIGQLMRLLTIWAKQLIKLTIFISFKGNAHKSDDAIKSQLLQLLATINRSPSLKHLKFWLESNLFDDKYTQVVCKDKLDLPILSRLESFTFHSIDEAGILMDSLLYFTGNNLNLVFLDIWNRFKRDSADRLLQLDSRIAQHFRTLNFEERWSPSEEQIRRFVEHFPKLRVLGLRLSGFAVSLPTLTRTLRPLTNLVTLILYITGLSAHLDAIQEESIGLEPGQEQVLETLPSVQYFDFNLMHGSFAAHHEFALLLFHQMFPNLKKMAICTKYHSCNVCGDFGPFEGRKERPEDWRRIEQCILQQMVEPIRSLFPEGARFVLQQK